MKESKEEILNRFERLRRFVPICKNGYYKVFRLSPEYFNQKFLTINNKYVYIVETDDYYNEYDNISDYFIRDLRIKSFTGNECFERQNKIRECYTFQPHLMVAFVKYFGATEVLDISSRWGDRLIAALALDIKYTGVDPNKDLSKKYDEMISFFNGDPLKYKMIISSFETANIEDSSPDMIFSSPFISDEYNKQNIDIWYNNLLFSLKKAYNKLRNYGYMIININDPSPNHNIHYVNRMIHDLSQFEKISYLGCISSYDDTSKEQSANPFFIWRKIDKLEQNNVISFDVKNIKDYDPDYILNEVLMYEPYRLKSIEKIKEQLNMEKDKIPSGKIYETVSRDLRLSHFTEEKIRTKYNGEHVTRAWMKCYELLSFYELISPKDGEVVAFLNAELPGAFICALNHMMKTRYKNVKFNWFASSLVPEKGVNALQDTYNIWKNNKSHWLMNVNSKDNNDPKSPNYFNNGDVTNINNIKNFSFKLPKKVQLYTHDAGIDVTDDPNNQEILNAKIHLGCAISAFATLDKGGNFIGKQYTFFEPITISLIFIYSALFKEFFICKPTSSGGTNSEIYLIGKEFLGIDQNLLKFLFCKLENFDTIGMKPMLPEKEVIRLYYPYVKKWTSELSNMQISFIQESIKIYQMPINILKLTLPYKMKYEDNWFKHNKISYLDRKDWV